MAFRISAKTCPVSFKTRFSQSSGFESLPLYFEKILTSDPILSRGLGFGRLCLVLISSQLWFDSIYFLPISNWPWCYPVGRLHPVSFWFDYTFSPLFLIWTWSRPVTLQFLNQHPKINTCQNSPKQSFYFICRWLIIYLENISSSVSTNCSRASF